MAGSFDNLYEMWGEDELVALSDCPLCFVCHGHHVWLGWNPPRPCIVCSGHGRMPFIAPRSRRGR